MVKDLKLGAYTGSNTLSNILNNFSGENRFIILLMMQVM